MICKVTVVIPVYNTKKYLEECVLSVIEQTYHNIEILLVDDGSTDGSDLLCDLLANTDERIRVIHKDNGGAASARNIGIDEALGEYIMFLDSDDWLDVNAIEVLVNKADSEGIDIVRFNYIREFKEKRLAKKNTFLKETLYTGAECAILCRQTLGLVGEELKHPENMNFLASCGFSLYRTKLLRASNVRFVPIKEIGSFVDGFFNFCVSFQIQKFAFIDRPFYHYRKTNEGAATACYRKEYLQRQLLLFGKLKEKIDIEQKWEELSDAFYSRISISTMEICFNAMRNREGFLSRYREIRNVLKHSMFKESYRSLDISFMQLKWRIYFFFIKHSMTFPVYVMTKIILLLKERGTV